MSDFQTALDYVHSALRGLHARGVTLRASATSLATLSALTEEPLAAKQVSVEDRPRTGSVAPPAERFQPSPQESAPRATPPLAPSIPPPPALPVFTPAIAPAAAPAKAAVPAAAPAAGSKAEQLAAMRDPVLACTLCPHLVRSRTQVVFGVGNPEAELMFVGEAPGEDEDRQGEPFVGKAGQLLTKIIETMGFRRSDVYIANVLKCRPDMPPGAPGNRKPTSPEMQTCLPYLQRQIDIIQPRAIVALGATAMEGLTGDTAPMSRLRGKWHSFGGIPLMATYHPAYLLRNQALSEKRKVWEDMLMVLERLGKSISQKQRTYFLPKE